MPTTLLVPEMKPILGGAFLMGNDRGRPDEKPQHKVRVGNFRAALKPVNNAEYDCFVQARGTEPSPFRREDRFAGAELPATGINWFEAVEYCAWLAGQTGTRFRLPTEAEREYAARGGLPAGEWPWGDEAPGQRNEQGPIAGLSRPHAPLSECLNGFGLYCMADNLHEWCSDWYEADYYGRSALESPTGPGEGRRRASRGGSWRHQIKFNRVSARSSLNPEFRYNDYGFRVYADE